MASVSDGFYTYSDSDQSEVARMSISIISFTRRGLLLSGKLGEALEGAKLYSAWREMDGREFPRVVPVPDTGAFAKENFEQKNPLVFIGACGIAVRSIAPYVRDKMTDPPVVVIDEGGRYVIPLLSGHVGGANDLAVRISSIIKAECVITTATDINGKFSVDSFAVKNNMSIANKGQIAAVASKLLSGKRVRLCVNPADRKAELPEEIRARLAGRKMLFVLGEPAGDILPPRSFSIWE